MKIAKIKNRYMFNSSNPNGYHDYLVYKDKNSGQIRAIQLTHLYNEDRLRFSQIRSGLLKSFKLPHRETPSGVNNGYITTDINGNPLNLRHSDVDLNTYRKHRITQKKQNDILNFAHRRKR